MANPERETILREIARWVLDRGGSMQLRSLQGWIGQQYGVSWRTADNYLGDLYVRGILRRYFGSVEITSRGRRLFVDQIGWTGERDG